MRFHWLAAALVLSVALAATQFIALRDFLYWRYPWFDVPMHLLGGLATATFLIALLEKRRALLFSLLFVVVLVVWEVLEYVFGVPREANYVFDTALDFLMGAVGGICVYIVARTTVWR